MAPTKNTAPCNILYLTFTLFREAAQDFVILRRIVGQLSFHSVDSSLEIDSIVCHEAKASVFLMFLRERQSAGRGAGGEWLQRKKETVSETGSIQALRCQHKSLTRGWNS